MSKISPYNGIFKNLDTPEKIYWFGFIVGDGNIYLGNKKRKAYQFSIVLKDKEHVEKLAIFLGYSLDRIRLVRNKYHLLSLHSKQLVEDLISHGLTIRKSFTVNGSIIPCRYKWDFIRGLFDADGCVTIKKSSRASWLEPIVSFTGNYPLLKSIENIIDDGGYLKENRCINGAADRLCYGGRLKVERILDKIYYTSPYLVRKYNLYIEIKRFNDKHRVIDPKTGKGTIVIDKLNYFERYCLFCGKKFFVSPCKAKHENQGRFCSGSHAKLYYWNVKKKGVGNFAYNAV